MLDFKKASHYFRYEPGSGLIYRKIKVSTNTCVGQLVGNRQYANGYGMIGFEQKKYSSHRLAWLLHNGEWPKQQIDHINGNRIDNRIVNLRDVNCAENNRNRPIAKNNNSGHVGVSWDKDKNKWKAYIDIAGKTKTLGAYKLLSDAIVARSAASIENSYHENHGRVMIR